MFDDLLKLPTGLVTFWSGTETKYSFLKEAFSILGTDDEVVNHFRQHGNSFVVCVGGVENRKMLLDKFTRLGGVPRTFISPHSTISPFAKIGEGSLILSRVELEAYAVIGKNCLLNKTANIGHGCVLGDNCEVTPGVILTGEVIVGNDSSIGTGSIVLPKIHIGNNVTLAAGSLVKKNVPDNAVVSGDFSTVKFFKKNES